jgi:DNA replication protein DnaC
VEVFYKRERIASHVRDDQPYRFTTLPEHRPESHRAVLEWNPERFISWAERTGPLVAEMVCRIIITGPTGAGKTYLACALGQSACRNSVSVRFFQISKLLQKITCARAEGSSPRFLESLAKTQPLIIDDWLRNPLTESQTPDLLEILEDRYGRASTMLATQIPVADWHDRLGNATLSDAVMDRIIHNAYRLELSGESMRKRRSPLTHSGHKEV